ncbi:hypothetical protein [Paludibaculum fermentans]|uniref:hypothetical protein n=1 Tax=Paludibaculum fermentans TaxID=1473598 RepID=UPI003EB80D74
MVRIRLLHLGPYDGHANPGSIGRTGFETVLIALPYLLPYFARGARFSLLC